VWNAVARYRRASEANEIDGVMETLAPDVELVSPLSGRMVFRGTDDLPVLLAAVYDSRVGLRWRHEAGNVGSWRWRSWRPASRCRDWPSAAQALAW
jgi:hypothetical protein